MSMPEEIGMFLFGTTVFSSVMWVRAAMAKKKIEHRLWGIAAAQGLPVTALSDDVPMMGAMGAAMNGSPRVQQLEQQVDAITQQLERLTESQEFLSRVLTERIDQLPDPRLRTPH